MSSANSLKLNLQELGFGKNETKVYLALFDIGKSKANVIIENTGMHRSLVYTALDELENRKLITRVMHEGVAVYEINNPELILNDIDKKRAVAEEVVKELKNKQTAPTRDITIYDGLDGLIEARKKIFQLKENETAYALGGSNILAREEVSRLWKPYHELRGKRKINLKMLCDYSVPQSYVDKKNSQSNSKAKYLPFNVELPALFEMYGDVLNIAIRGEEPTVISIRAPEAAESLRRYFEYFWNQEISLETGMPALEHAFYNMINELKSGEEYYVLGASTNTYDSDSGNLRVQTFFNDVHTKRIQKGVVVKMLAYREYVARGKQRFVDCGDPEGAVSFIKPFINTPRVPMQINLYRNKTLIIFYSETPTVLTFERPEMYEGFKAYFDSQWNQETYILKGPEALQNIWLESIDTGGMRFIGARGFFMDRYPNLMKPIIEKMTHSKNVYWKNIVDPGVRGHKITSFPWSQTKYTLSNSKNLNVVWLWGNKVAIVNWAGDEPIILVSENKNLVQSYSDNFEELWKK